MALIPDRIVRISMAYKIATIVAYALALCCFFWDIYTHDLLMETQENLLKEQKNVETLVTVMRMLQEDCYDGN
jgi:hypothetical protein